MEDYYTVKDGDNLVYKITAIEDDYYVLSGVEYRKIRKVHKEYTCEVYYEVTTRKGKKDEEIYTCYDDFGDGGSACWMREGNRHRED